MINVLFVCMGNICRSPTAEGVFRHVVSSADLDDQIRVDSAGTHAYHTGSPADRRASAAAERRGYSLADTRARPVVDSDFDEFDYIIAMDLDNVDALQNRADDIHHSKIKLMLDFTSGPETEVPDPYYGGSAGFEKVLDLVEDASRGLLETLSKQIR